MMPVCLVEEDVDSHKIYSSVNADTGIHVYHGSNGMVMMEVVGIADDFSEGGRVAFVERVKARSNYESRCLLNEQVSFCELHPTLLNDLAAYGVVAKTRSDRVPAEENSVVFQSAVRQTSDDQSLKPSGNCKL